MQQQQLQQSGNDEERIVASTSSPVTRRVKTRAANARNDEAPNDEDTSETASAVTTGTCKRKRSVSSEPKSENIDVNRNTPVRLHVRSLIDTVRPHLLHLVEDTNNVDLWITLLCPRLEDGNNRALEVQYSVKDVVTSAAVRRRIIALFLPPRTLCNAQRSSVCLSVCQQLYVKTTKRTFTKILPQMYPCAKKN